MRFHSGMEEEDKRTVYGQPCVLQQVAPVLASLSLDMVPERAHLICGWIIILSFSLLHQSIMIINITIYKEDYHVADT